MRRIVSDIHKTEDVWEKAEQKFGITVRDDIRSFLQDNGGGYPEKDVINVEGEDYEVRIFLSADAEDENYYIGKPLDYFLTKTNGKIIPIGIDSGDNYYCVNNETGKVYYWRAEQDSYYQIAENLDNFCGLFEN